MLYFISSVGLYFSCNQLLKLCKNKRKMSLIKLFKFNKNLFTNLKLQMCRVHSMLQIYNDNSETNVGKHVKVQVSYIL